MVQSVPLKIFFTYQSWQNTPFEWFTIFTLCLAPLVTHIAFGLAKTVVLSEDSPLWTEKITQFNPVSIVWRYYAIAYRRLRATSWDAADMVACNAMFWDGKLWDGSENMMIRSREYLTSPHSNHVALVSGSSIATIVLALQGVQAIFYIIENTLQNPLDMSIADGIPHLFMRIGLLGLLRIPAAYWVTNDFEYKIKGSQQPYVDFSYLTDPELEVWKFAVRRRLGDTRSWKCTFYRTWWLGTVLAVAGLATYDMLAGFILPGAKMGFQSLFEFLYLLMYLQLAVGCAIIHIVYVLRRDHVSTVIPCIQSKWYKLYTWILIVATIVTVIVGSLETVLLPDGSYTTSPPLDCSSAEGTCTALNKTAILEYVDSEWERFLEGWSRHVS
jgi:hypothetical protein